MHGSVTIAWDDVVRSQGLVTGLRHGTGVAEFSFEALESLLLALLLVVVRERAQVFTDVFIVS